MRRAVAVALDRQGVLVPGERAVLAVSGGADSTVLLDALARLAPARRLHLEVAHVDHALRPGSDEEAGLVAELARARGLPFTALTVHVDRVGSLQAAARRARHAALEGLAGRLHASVIAYGHTADDQAETVLMAVLSGAAPRILAGMAGRERWRARPLLQLWRCDIDAYCAALGLQPIADPSNHDRRFLRVRVRQELIPVLESAAPGVRRRLVMLAAQQRSHAWSGQGRPGSESPAGTASGHRPSGVASQRRPPAAPGTVAEGRSEPGC